MDYYDLIRQCTSHIRRDPCKRITAGDLAASCGYSLYHLSSVFRICLGCSVGRFIQEEKLRLAAEQLRDGRKITEVALDAGFDTSSGFTKAFHRQFGCSPRAYRSLTSLPSSPSIIPSDKAILPYPSLQPEYVKRNDLKVYGYIIPVEESHKQFKKAAFWSHIDFKKLPPYPGDASDYAEVGIWLNPDTGSGQMDYFFGYVTNDPSPAEGFQHIDLAGGDYALFRLPYPTDKNQTDNDKAGSSTMDALARHVETLWLYIFEEWLSDERKVRFDDSRLCFEKYGTEYAEIYIPIKS